MRQVDYPLDTEVEPNVRKRVSKLNGILVDPRQPSGIAQESWSHRGLISAIVKDQPRETKAAEDMPPVAQIEKQFSVAQPPVALHPVIEQAPPADVSGEGSTQCLSEPLVAHSDHQAAGDEQPVSLTPPEHQPDIVRSPVCPTEHQQDVYDPQVALPKLLQERDAGEPQVAPPPGEQDASEPVALPKQERDAGEPLVALPPGEQDASGPPMARPEHVHDAGELPMLLPGYVPGAGEAPVAPAFYQWYVKVSPLLAEPVLEVPGLDCENLVMHALQRAYVGVFPAEAMKTDELGYYANYLKPYFEQMPNWNRELAATNTERNFPARIAYDATMLERLMTTAPEDLHPALQKSEGWLHDHLTLCMGILPDITQNGWVAMGWRAFADDPRFKGNPSIFLHFLFAKHAGEVIFVQRDEVGTAARPWNVNAHHPQFYIDAHMNPVSAGKAELAAGVFWVRRKDKRKGAAGGAKILWQLTGCDNSVLKAVPTATGADGVAQRRFKYHSLPSLVYACCSVANIFEIYTWYCLQPQICCRQKHWHRGPRAR